MVVQTRHIRLYEKRYSVKSEAMSRYCLKMGFRIAKAQIAQYTNVVQGLCGLTSWNNCLVLAFVSSWEVISLQSLNKTLTWCIQYRDIILRIFVWYHQWQGCVMHLPDLKPITRCMHTMSKVGRFPEHHLHNAWLICKECRTTLLKCSDYYKLLTSWGQMKCSRGRHYLYIIEYKF
mgnify:CR=1 FL=1